MSQEWPTAWRVVHARLTTATGSNSYAGGRIRPVRMAQDDDLPAITYRTVSTIREHAMGSDPGHMHSRVQIDIYDRTWKGTASGKNHVMDALSRFSGTATGITVFDVFYENELDAYQDELEGAERTVWRRTIDFTVHYEE